MAKERIDLIISAKNQADRAIASVTGNIKGLAGQVFSLKTALAGLGIGLLVRDLTNASGEQRRAVAGLDTALRSMGRYTPELSDELQNLAAGMQQVTNYGDEATIQGQKFLVTYRGITDELLGRSTAAMLDLAALMGGDVTSAANMLGKASMGMTGELRRVGITVDEETFKLHGYAGVLAEIESQVGGQARAMRDASGPWIALGNAIGDTKEQAGDIINDVFGPLGDEVTSMIGVINERLDAFKESTDFEPWANNLRRTVIGGFKDTLLGSARIVDGFAPVIKDVWGAVQELWDGFQKLPRWVKEIGILGAVMGGIKGKALLVLTAQTVEWVDLVADQLDAAKKGYIKYTDIVTSGSMEEGRQLLEDSYYYKRKEGREPIWSDRGRIVGWTDPVKEKLQDLKIETGSAEAAVLKLFELLEAGPKNIAPTSNEGTGPKPSVPVSTGDTQSDSVQKVIDALRYEQEQLSRDVTLQRVYNELKKAGVELNSKAGQSIQALVSDIEEETAAKQAQLDLEAEGAQVTASVRTETEKLADEIQRLNELRAAGAITDETYNRATTAANAQYGQADTPETDDYWTNYLANMEASLTSLDELAGSTLENLSQRFGSFFESAIFDSQNLGDAFATMAEGMGRSLVGAIGEMIAQWLVYKVVKSSIDKTTQASAAATMSANAEAASLQAGINAYASAAAIPLTGWMMAPGAMAGAIAATSPLVASIASLSASAVGMAHEGIDSVPTAGTWLLDKGERVTTANTSAKLDRVLGRIEAGLGSAGGGTAQPPPAQPAAQATPQSIRVVNVMDPSIVESWANSSSGEKVVMNILSRNAGQVRQMIGG